MNRQKVIALEVLGDVLVFGAVLICSALLAIDSEKLNRILYFFKWPGLSLAISVILVVLIGWEYCLWRLDRTCLSEALYGNNRVCDFCKTLLGHIGSLPAGMREVYLQGWEPCKILLRERTIEMAVNNLAEEIVFRGALLLILAHAGVWWVIAYLPVQAFIGGVGHLGLLQQVFLSGTYRTEFGSDTLRHRFLFDPIAGIGYGVLALSSGTLLFPALLHIARNLVDDLWREYFAAMPCRHCVSEKLSDSVS